MLEANATQMDVSLRVLGYREEGEWVALALEMDLRGYGATFQAALDDLRELVLMQIGFAFSKNQPEMIWKPAEPVWFARYEELRSLSLRQKLVDDTARNRRADSEISGIQIPPPHVIEGIKASFSVDA